MSVSYTNLLPMSELTRLTPKQQRDYIRFLWGLGYNTACKLARVLKVQNDEYLEYTRSTLGMKPYPKDRRKKELIDERKKNDEKLSQGFELKISVSEVCSELLSDEVPENRTFLGQCANKIRTEVDKMAPKKVDLIAALKKENPRRTLKDLTDDDRGLLIKLAEANGVHYEEPSLTFKRLCSDEEAKTAAVDYISGLRKFFGISLSYYVRTSNRLLGSGSDSCLSSRYVYKTVYEVENPGKSYGAYQREQTRNRQNGNQTHQNRARGTNGQNKAFEIFMGITHEKDAAFEETPAENGTLVAPSPSEEPTTATPAPEPEIPEKILTFYGLRTGKTIQGITGKSLGDLNDDDVTSIAKFCPLKPLSGAEFMCLDKSIKKLYLLEVAQFFMATWTDIAKFWFNNEVTGEELKQLSREFELPQIPIACDPAVVRALKKTARNMDSFETRAKAKDFDELRTVMLRVLDGNSSYEEREEAVNMFNVILNLPCPTGIAVWGDAALETIRGNGAEEVANEPSTPPQNDSETSCSEGEAEANAAFRTVSDAPVEETVVSEVEPERTDVPEASSEGEPERTDVSEVSPEGELGATDASDNDSEAKPAPTRETLRLKGVDVSYELKAWLPRKVFYEIEGILRKCEDAGMARILQSNRLYFDPTATLS